MKKKSVKIELEYPYNEHWKFGYIVTNPENRKNVILYNSPSDRTTTALARYMLSVELGRYLEPHEQVDHIDEDKTNDTISNLQILTVKENNIKHSNFVGGAKWVDIQCPICGKIFSTEKRNTFLLKCYYGQIQTCSRRCGGQSCSIYKNLTPLEKQEINYCSLVRIFNKLK